LTKQFLVYSTGVLIATGHGFHFSLHPSLLPVRSLPRRRLAVAFAARLRRSGPG